MYVYMFKKFKYIPSVEDQHKMTEKKLNTQLNIWPIRCRSRVSC